MPELPEVEAARRRVHSSCLGHVISEVEIAEDTKVFDKEAPDHIKHLILGRKIVNTKRKGKYFWLEMDQGPCLTFHLGMTGNISIDGIPSHKYKRFKTDYEVWPPRFWKLDLKLNNGIRVAYTDPRRFGKIRMNENPLLEAPINKLGFDPLLDMPNEKQFAEMIPGRRAPIKALLLDQSFAAGIGNWVADEILFQARIHPEQPCNSLSTSQTQVLHKKMSEIIKLACKCDADYDEFPESWIFHHRWGKQAGAKVEGKAISFITCGGRTTAFVPALQKKSSTTSVKKEDNAEEVQIKEELESEDSKKALKTKAARRTVKRKAPANLTPKVKAMAPRAIKTRKTRASAKALAA